MSTIETSAQVPKLRFPGFEGEWWTKPLLALSQKSITYGIVQTGEPVDGGVKCVRVVDLTKSQIDLSALITTTPEISRSYKRTILEEGEIMVALRGEIGLVALVPVELAGSNLTRGIARIAPNRSEVTPGFLLWSLRCDHAKAEFNKQVNGSALKEIPINGLNKVEVRLTTLPEQQKIAAFLTAVDGRIEQLSRKKALLEEYKKGVMQQLFTQTLRFQDDHGHDFPDWEEKTLGDVADFLDSKRVPLSQEERSHKQGPYRYYGASGVIDHVDEFIFDGEYVLLGEDGANIITRSTRLAFVVSGKFWVNNHAHVLKAHGSSLFLAEALEQLDYSQYNTGTAQPKLNAKVCQQIRLQLPSLPEQTKIAGFLSALDGKIGAVGEQMRQTQAWKKGLLQQMFV